MWSWVFPGIMIPVMATLRRTILIELLLYTPYDRVLLSSHVSLLMTQGSERLSKSPKVTQEAL